MVRTPDLGYEGRSQLVQKTVRVIHQGSKNTDGVYSSYL